MFIVKEKTDGQMIKSQMVDIFGEIYWMAPSTFQFSPGDRKLINVIVTHVKQVSDVRGINYFQGNISENNIVKGIEQLMLENDDGSKVSENARRTRHFLNILQITATRNETRKRGGYRYDFQVKLFASYFRMIAGPLAYNIIQKNMPCALPSLSSTNRYINSSNCHIVEGILRSNELLIYLNERQLPLAVSISEDETHIVGRIQYDVKTNQIIGFTLPLNKSNGMPIPFSFPARNAPEILKHFAIENPISTYVNAIMAQPLSNKHIPAFCLMLFGSDGKYTANDVSFRWDHIKKELSLLGIHTLTVGSDGNPKYEAAMRRKLNLGSKSSIVNTDWFFCNEENTGGTFYTQDLPHIATKLRNWFLVRSYRKLQLPFGKKYFITLKHLYYLLDNFSKDRHLLTQTALNPADRQNFDTVLQICSERVTDLLKLSVDGSEATVFFLETIREILDSFMNPNLKPLQRIKKIWYRVLVIRLWRRFISLHRNYSLTDNFLTQNCYSCIEINAHCLIFIILHLRGINKPDHFLPSLFGSQQCENMFRKFRSFTTTYSSISNCSVKEMLARISKIGFSNEIKQMTSAYFEYSSFGTKNKGLQKTSSLETFELPSLEQIIEEVEQCKSDAIKTAIQFKLITEKEIHQPDIFSCKIKPYTPTRTQKDQLTPIMITKELKLSDLRGINLKNFPEKTDIDESSPFIELFSGKYKNRVVVKKSSLCWLLRKDWRRVSSDRLRRVQCSSQNNIFTRQAKRLQSKKHNKRPRLMYPYKAINKRFNWRSSK